MARHFYHGGAAGFNVGDILRPTPPHAEDGCIICNARRTDQTVTVGEYRNWLAAKGTAGGERGAQLLRNLNPNTVLDPPSQRGGIWITMDLPWAAWYADGCRGDLYRVVPLSEPALPLVPSMLPTFITAEARVVEVMRRGVRLNRADRRALARRLSKAAPKEGGW